MSNRNGIINVDPVGDLIMPDTMYREMDMRFWLDQAEAQLKELLA